MSCSSSWRPLGGGGGLKSSSSQQTAALLQQQQQQHHQLLRGSLRRQPHSRGAAECRAVPAPAPHHSQPPPQQQLLQPAAAVLPLSGGWGCGQQQHTLLPLQPQPARRRASIAAAGRRRRSELPSESARGADEDDPGLDLDDVMYGGVGDEEADASLLDEDEEDEYEFDDEFEDEDVDDDDADEGEEQQGAAAAAAGAGGDGGSWDAALVNFDESQDAAPPPREPTPEEREHAAALEMVRYDEDDALSDGTSLTVSEVPPAPPSRPKTFAEQAEGLAPADRAALEANLASYTVFPMFFLELLVASTPDGQLVLSDVFARDTYFDSFVRPAVSSEVPSQPGLYQVVPWEVVETGDTIKGVPDDHQVHKLYFVGLHSTSPHEVDMSHLYCFDALERAFVALSPRILGGAASLAEMRDPVMRIREDGVWVEEAEQLPGTYFIAEGFAGRPDEAYTPAAQAALPAGADAFDPHDYVAMGMWERPRTEQELAEVQALIGERRRAAAAAAVISEGGLIPLQFASPAGSVAGGAAAGGGGGAGGNGSGLVPAATSAASAGAAAVDDAAGAGDDQAGLEERLEELELMEELDDLPDVPAVDMM